MKAPAVQWYFGDWLRCAELRLCCSAARGLWIDMLALMHQAEPYGYLMFNGRAIDAAQLAKMVGEDRRNVAKWLKELADNGVYSVDSKGAMFCRRMVRDEAKRAEWREEKRGQRGDKAPDKSRTPKQTNGQTHPHVSTTSPPDLHSSDLHSSNHSAREETETHNPRLPHRWWSTEKGIVTAGQAVGVEARIGESMDGFKRRVELAIAKRKQNNGDRSPTSFE